MKMLAFFFALMLSAAFSEDAIKLDAFTVGSREYQNVTIEKIDEVSARVIHSSGVARIPISQLSQDLQRRLGFDAAKAEAVIQQQKQAQAAAIEKAAIAAIPYTRFWVESNGKKALIVGGFTESKQFVGGGLSRSGGGSGYMATRTERNFDFAYIPHLKETTKLVDGAEFWGKVKPDGVIRLETGETVKKYRLFGVKLGVKAPEPRVTD